ncbi:PqqD family protein [Petralouisia muris]|jgi:hypothetical protein|uniref:PqqD family protein n=1 Tax=Petralouisia muris TaxID=3032872 RepID=A0AC61RQF8_9FIRM|nr:PqqD family protein [Petralouisia muris]TGY89438.1 PqqD family protein [Petralouisia muris]
MEINKIPTLKTICWKITDGYVIVDSARGHFILNDTSSIVWKCIDGRKTVADIIREIHVKHSEENTLAQIEEIVCEAITSYMENDLVLLCEDDDLDGWLQYE